MKRVVILRSKGLGLCCKDIASLTEHPVQIAKVRPNRALPNNIDLLLRWGCTTNYDANETLNNVEAIRKVSNKSFSRLLMQNNNISVPKLYKEIDEDIDYPVVVRPSKHSKGKHLWLCNNKEELLNVISKLETYYISKYIKKERELGIFIFNDRVTSVIEKIPAKENANENIVWNYDSGSHTFTNINWENWHIESCKEALKAMKLFGLTFGRVDVIIKDNIPYILELNSAHGLTSPYRQETFAKCLDYYINNGSVQNEIDFSKNLSYKSIIHPTLRENKEKYNL